MSILSDAPERTAESVATLMPRRSHTMNAVAAMPEPRSSERLTLADGADVEIRPLERSDREALASAVARLSERSR